MTLGSHQRSVGKSQVHITPRWIIDKLGPFDLDPCAAKIRPWNCASVNWCGIPTTNGLEEDWYGFVWLNPPFNRYEVGQWIAKLAEHNNGIALLHARTEAAWFEPCWRHAKSILFMADRIKFCMPSGAEQPANSGAPPVLVAFGDLAAGRLRRSRIPGFLVTQWSMQDATP